jgi:DNA invertase Pin-like site-specific DNA recombinase
MIAAIYARKSTEQTGVSEEAKSVARQCEHAKAYAHKKGLMVAGEHIYIDDEISGAEFGGRCPGLERLVGQLKPPPVSGVDPVRGITPVP